MRLKGYPTNGETSLSYLGTPSGSLVGHDDTPIDKTITVPGATGPAGPAGASGSGSGDMLASTYDPTGIHASAFNLDNMVDGTTKKGFTATEKSKLAGVQAGATANAADSTLENRANHTGTQSADTLTDGTTKKAFLATERTKLAGIATGATADPSYSSIAALKAATVSTAQVRVLGYYAPGDGGGGVFRWDGTDTTSTDNGGTIITPTSLSGRWKRVYEGEVNACWFGVSEDQPDDDNTAPLQAAVDWVSRGSHIGGTLFIPSGWYDFAFDAGTSGLSTITVGASNVLIRGEGKSTRLNVRDHAYPDQLDYFFTFSMSGRGEGGGVVDLNFYGSSMLKWCIYLNTWRDAEFRNISAFDIHGGILDAEANDTTNYGENILVDHLDTSGATGTTLTQYGVRFRAGSGTGAKSWSDCTIRNSIFVLCWDTGVVLDGVDRFTVSGIGSANNGTSTDTIDGSSKTGALHVVKITHTIANDLPSGYHVVDSIYLESGSGSESFANNNAVFIHEITGINSQIRWNRISNVVANDTSTGLLKLADDSGFGRLNNTTFTGNRGTVNGGIVIGAGVDQTDLYLTPDDGRDWGALISDAGTNTRVNGVAPVGVVLRPPPAMFDSFTAANSSAPDAGKWSTTIGSGSGAAISVQGNALQMTSGATGGFTSNDWVTLTSALGSTLVDGEVEFCLTSSSVTVESYLYVGLRASSATAVGDGYWLMLAQDTGGYLHAEIIERPPHASLYTGPSILQTAGKKTWFRFRIKGTALKLWTWADGDIPATIPAWTGTDSSITAGGYVTFTLTGGSAATSGVQKIDNVAIYAL